MTIVSVETELLTSGGEKIAEYKNDNELHYNNVTSLSINSCSSFESFKNALSDQFSTYSKHCDIAASRIEECANALIEIDAQIAGDSEATSKISETTNEDISEFTSLSGLTAISSINVVVDIESLISLSDNERKQVFNDLSSSLTNAVSSIENGNGSYESNSEYELVNKLVDNFMDNISTTNSDGTVTHKVNDLVKNDFYNEVVKEYGEAANIKITPDMLHYASRNKLPLIRENISEYNLTFNGSNQPTEVGQEYNFYSAGIVDGDEKTSPYSSELYNTTIERNNSNTSVNEPTTSVNKPDKSDNTITTPDNTTEKPSTIVNKPDDPFYNQQQTTKNNNTSTKSSSSNVRKGIATTILGLGAAGAVGAAGYGVYKKKKRDQEDEEEDTTNDEYDVHIPEENIQNEE